MKENVGKKDRIIRTIIGTALLPLGYKKWGGENGNILGISVMMFGALLLESVITRVCPINNALGVNTKRERGPVKKLKRKISRIKL